MLGQKMISRENFNFSSSSFEYDDNDNSSLDSGIERSFEANETAARKLNFNSPTKSTYPSKRRIYRSSKVSLKEYEELEREFKPAYEATATSTPQKPKRRYAQGKFRISRSQDPTQIVKIKKYRRIKANDRERNRMHSLNEALGKWLCMTDFSRVIFVIVCRSSTLTDAFEYLESISWFYARWCSIPIKKLFQFFKLEIIF